MVVLKKIKASTLMETMVATVLIVVLFMMSSMLLNSIFTATTKGNTQAIYEKLNELEYRCKTGEIVMPYTENWNDWEIQITPNITENIHIFQLEAIHQKSEKSVVSYSYEK